MLPLGSSVKVFAPPAWLTPFRTGNLGQLASFPERLQRSIVQTQKPMAQGEKVRGVVESSFSGSPSLVTVVHCRSASILPPWTIRFLLAVRLPA